jgi:hypothetical protein
MHFNNNIHYICFNIHYFIRLIFFFQFYNKNYLYIILTFFLRTIFHLLFKYIIYKFYIFCIFYAAYFCFFLLFWFYCKTYFSKLEQENDPYMLCTVFNFFSNFIFLLCFILLFTEKWKQV